MLAMPVGLQRVSTAPLPALVPVLLGLAVLVLYILCAGPTFYWLDSPEFVAAAWGLGVAHPPGHPLPSLLARLVCLLPIGTIAFRVTLASALQAAAATALTAVLCGQVVSRLPAAERSRAWIRPIGCVIAALCVGLSYALAFQAVRAEVYALNVLALLGGCTLVLSWDATGDRRRLLCAALVFGLALCNHHFLVLLALPAVLAFVLWRRPAASWRRAVVGVLLAGALGLSTLAYLPLRAARGPEVSWGSPTTVERFGWVVSAQAFHKALDRAASETVAHRALGAVFALLGGLGPVAALLAFGGLYLLWRRAETRRAALLLTGLVGLNLLSPMIVGFDPFNPDAHGYLAVAVATLSPGLAVLLVVVAEALSARRLLPALLCAAAAGLPLSLAATRVPQIDLRDHWAAEETGRQILDQPPGALLLTSYFETLFNVWALQETADLRPDLLVLHRNFLATPGYVEGLERRAARDASSGELAALARRWRAAGRLLLDDLDRLTAARAVLIEHDLNVPRELVRRLRSSGLAQTYGPARADDLARHIERVEGWMRAVGVVSEGETRRAVVWTHYLLLDLACQRGETAMARFHLERARTLAPRDARLGELSRRCALVP
jgi:hypothetical protein